MSHSTDTKSGRWYIDPSDDKRRFPSVTTVIGTAIAKPALLPAAAKLIATYAVEQHDIIGQILTTPGGDKAAIDLVRGAAERAWSGKADLGTLVHGVIETLTIDAPMPDIPDGADGYLDAFLQFWTDWQPAYELSEATVCNTRLGIAGRLDGVAVIPALGPNPKLIDYKTGRGVWGEVALQMAAYASADEVWLDDGLGTKAAMPAVDGALVLHLHEDGTYDLLPVELRPAHLAAVEAALGIFTWVTEEAKSAIGRRIRPGLVVHVEDCTELPSNIRNALTIRGVVTLPDLAALGVDAFGEINGVGKVAVEKATALLATEGLEWADTGELVAA